MDYEEKYRDLVKAVKELQEANPSDDGIQNWVKDNVPELKESEDEKMKREILELVSIAGNSNQFEEIKDWLEKQGEQNTKDKKFQTS